MRIFGWFVLVIGVIWIIAAMNMNVTVSVGDGRYVNNIYTVNLKLQDAASGNCH